MTAGRWPTAVLWSVVAALAARELLVVWTRATTSDPDEMPAPLLLGAAMVLAPLAPLAGALGTGVAGAVLLVVAAALGLVLVGARRGLGGLDAAGATSLAVAVLLPAVPALAVVLVVASHLWAGLFLVVAVSLYDAGNYIGAAETSSRLEGPVTGIVGVLAVTFTMAIFRAPPFDVLSAAIVGGVCAIACPVGQWITSAFLPDADAPCRSMRRLDAYVLAAPAFLAAVWMLA